MNSFLRRAPSLRQARLAARINPASLRLTGAKLWVRPRGAATARGRSQPQFLHAHSARLSRHPAAERTGSPGSEQRARQGRKSRRERPVKRPRRPPPPAPQSTRGERHPARLPHPASGGRGGKRGPAVMRGRWAPRCRDGSQPSPGKVAQVPWIPVWWDISHRRASPRPGQCRLPRPSPPRTRDAPPPLSGRERARRLPGPAGPGRPQCHRRG